MRDILVATLRSHDSEIRTRWSALLRTEQVNTPLANPDTLVFLFGQTLEDIYAVLRRPSALRDTGGPDCRCGRNPLLAYFRAAEQVLLEALVLAQAEAGVVDPKLRDEDLQELKRAVRAVAKREIETFGGLCQHRASAAPLVNGCLEATA